MMDNLHLIIKSGLPLYQGLLDISKDTENKRFKEMLLYIANSVNEGNSLSKAFQRYEKILGKIILNLIKIGEETGQLEITLERAAYFLKQTSELKKKAKSALIYPSFAFITVFIAMLVWMLYVLPQMTALFKSMDITLPPLTLAIMSLSNFLNDYIYYLIASFVLLIIIFQILYKKNLKFRYFITKLVLKIPIIKQIIIGFNIAFISEYLRLALISGVPIFTAMQTLVLNINNEVFKKALHNAKNDVGKGLSISSSFAKTKIFTPFTIRMINVGESSGNLDAQLEIISDFYYKRVDYFAENIGKVIEPLVLIFVGGFMALVIAGLMGPMYDLISQMK
jgi:type II secretory pathway component PulF